MKICHVITRLIIGGAQENTVLSCRGLAARGHDVTLIAGPETGPEGSLWQLARESGANAIELESMRRAVRPLADFRAYRELIACFKDLKPDVVHTHSSKAGILGRAAAAKAGVPVIVHTIHGMSFNRTQPWLTRTAYRLLERRAARYTDKIVTVADAMIEQAVAAGIGLRDQMVTIRSGLEVARFAPNEQSRKAVRAAWGVADDEIVVGTIARLFANKGYEAIMAAMPLALKRAPGLRFVWVGDGAHRERYERELQNMNLRDRVIMVGLVPPGEVAGLLTGFDLLVHASRWEGLPRAVVQALLAEVPAISFDNDGAPEVVLPDRTGLLAPLGDVQALSDAIVRLAGQGTLRRELGRNGRRHCLMEFDASRMVDRLDSLYRDLLQGQPPCHSPN
jgi:glycosyltransferase involved in cell wall biosynthesis